MRSLNCTAGFNYWLQLNCDALFILMGCDYPRLSPVSVKSAAAVLAEISRLGFFLQWHYRASYCTFVILNWLLGIKMSIYWLPDMEHFSKFEASEFLSTTRLPCDALFNFKHLDRSIYCPSFVLCCTQSNHFTLTVGRLRWSIAALYSQIESCRQLHARLEPRLAGSMRESETAKTILGWRNTPCPLLCYPSPSLFLSVPYTKQTVTAN